MDERIDKQINRIEQKPQKYTHMNLVNRSLVKEQRQYYGAKIVLSNKWYWNYWTSTGKK